LRERFLHNAGISGYASTVPLHAGSILKTIARMSLTVLQLALLVYLGVCLLLFLKQDAMVFFPEKAEETDLIRAAERDGLDPWRDRSGQIIGWVDPTGDDGRRVVLFHGNGGYALHRNAFPLHLRENGPASDWKIHLFEYPGYGARPGKPSERSFVDAAIEAVDQLISENPSPIWLVGQSLGTGVAAAVAARRPDAVAGVLLLTPFNRLCDVAQGHYPWLPISLLLRHRFDSEKHLSEYPGPVAIVVAESDSIIPARFGRRLYDRLTGTKRLWALPQADHNDFAAFLGPWLEALVWLSDRPSAPRP
jgi:pimeloyl-ACP methyl ester carboxylesterase